MADKRPGSSSRDTTRTPSDRADPVGPGAWRSVSAVATFLGAGLLGAAADLLTKHWAFAALLEEPGQTAGVIPGLLRLRLTTNRGIAFGLAAPAWVMAVATVGAVLAVGALFATSHRRQRTLHAALGMVLAGAAGNAYDRLLGRVQFPGEPAARIGEVRDFIDVYAINYPVFNVADMLLVVGVGLIMIHTWRRRHEG